MSGSVLIAGESGGRTEVGDIAQSGQGQGHEGIHVQPGRGRHPLHLAEQRHHVVGGDAGGRVVGGALVVVDLDAHPAEEAAQGGGHVVSAYGEGDAAAQPNTTHFGRGQGHEGMERGSALVGSEGVEAEGPRKMQDHGGADGNDGGGRLGHRRIRGGDDDHVDAFGRTRQIVAAVKDPAQHAAGVDQRRSK